ncbi:MAG TPA: AbrB family transcriptional regulator [Thauera sp.]|uniref:AbrB family transcriptional regulator n=1 Tax=unclassified Thauera TaxID=2609274 RepID=UPI0002CE178B|nr:MULTISPECIES: AbrB family transcriptional regulator [unclassified Thauera]HAY09246.1 AbrB family transcriptional regulator [Thauera sp.]ENO82859.1 membrane protein AbrB [Thauera sp. 27]WBL64369.1 AbrB family transcriptional regulator [Thauera sp. WB-2]HRJ24693.1 AbrB family transcriptional regulator [Thauera sp.]HRK10747.1 AbrB family transcriptional regulator [Thauera sp.]
MSSSTQKNSGASWRYVLATLVLAAVAGWLAERFHLPLPWMIGPLFAVAAVRMADIELRPLPGGRQSGQWAIGAALGLYFSPEVVAQLSLHAALVVAAAVGSLVLGVLCALIMRRLGGVDTPTAFFAALPGGASEMANLADRYGGAVDRIAAAHAIRVMMVVSLLPFALTFGGVHGSDLYVPIAQAVDARHFPQLVVASLLGVAAFKLLRIANAWVLGPLLGVAVATLAGVPLSALPVWVVNGGQLLIGCALGCRFSRAFFRAAPRFMAVAGLTAVMSIVFAGAFAALLALASGVPLPTLILATAPGGVSEMCITAKVLQLGVPLVTVCHVLRVVVLTVGAQWSFGAFRRMVET